MIRKLQKAASIGLLSILSAVTLMPPANAQISLDDMIRFYLGTGADASFAPNQGLISSNFSTRLSQLEAEISADLSAGRITTFEANTMRARLDQIRARISSAMADGRFSYGEVNHIVSLFGSATNELIAMRDGFGGGSGPIVPDANINARQRELRARLRDAERSGTITRWEADRIRADIEANVRLEAQLRIGGLTSFERNRLLTQLDRIDTRLDTAIAGGVGGGIDTNINARQRELERQISMALSRGHLSHSQAANLRYSLSWITNQERYMRMSGGLSASERLQLTAALDRVESRMEQYVAARGGGGFYFF